MADLLTGAPVVEAMNAASSARVAELARLGVVPTLAILRVGGKESEIAYERGACKRAEKVGVAVRLVTLTAAATQDEVLAAVRGLNEDAGVHGVLILRPLPAHIDDDLIRNALDHRKDVDGITSRSIAGVFTGVKSGFAPCTAQACMEIIEHYGIECEGKNAVVVGRSLVVGKPVAMMLLERNATVTVCHSRSVDLPAICRGADIIIACVGRAAMIDGSYLSAGQAVIDVGINVREDGSLTGDVDFAQATELVAAITPVPGGVGAVTTSVLMKHVLEAAALDR
jgi:methylenetetrahydrofolate dehydrogenase (NADP+)/methenyltetrahydrofolate cyclohydrolase